MPAPRNRYSLARKRRAGQGDRNGEDADGARGTATRPAGGASGPSTQSPDDIDFDDDEEPRDILAICKLGDKLGIAAVSTSWYR